jgi:general secretion pathway protein L
MINVLFNSGIGIDIDNRKVSVAFLKGSFRGVQLAAEQSLPLDDGKPVSERIRDAALFINGFIKEHQIPDIAVFIGMPGRHCMFREVEFPLAVKENLRSTLSYEMDKYIPLALEDIYFDYQIVSEDKAQQRLKVIIAVVKKDDAQPYLRLAELLDRGGSGMESSFAAISNYFFHQHGAVTDPAMVVCFKEDGFDIIHTHHGALIYGRSVEAAGPASEWGPQVVSHLTQVRNMFSKNGLAMKLCVYGHTVDSGAVNGLVENGQFEWVALKTDDNGLTGAASVCAAGLALRGVGRLPEQMNFMPAHLRKKPDKTSLIILMALAVLFVISGVMWIGSYVMTQRAIMAEMDQELDRLKSEAAEVEKIREEINGCQARIDFLSARRPGNVYMADIGKELSERIPASAWIKELKVSEDQLSLYGSADSASELIPLLEDSPVFSDVKFLSTIRKGKDDKELFRIGLKIVSPVSGEGGN